MHVSSRNTHRQARQMKAVLPTDDEMQSWWRAAGQAGDSRLADHERAGHADVVVGQHRDLLALSVLSQAEVVPRLGDVDVEALHAPVELQQPHPLLRSRQPAVWHHQTQSSQHQRRQPGRDSAMSSSLSTPHLVTWHLALGRLDAVLQRDQVPVLLLENQRRGVERRRRVAIDLRHRHTHMMWCL